MANTKRTPVPKRRAQDFSTAELDSILKSQGRYPGQPGAGLILERGPKNVAKPTQAALDSIKIEQMKRRQDVI